MVIIYEILTRQPYTSVGNGSGRKIEPTVLEEINNPDNEIYYSVLSVWEITLKNAKNPTAMPITGAEFVDYCDKSGFIRLPLINNHVKQLPTLKKDEAISHKDPFDRMLICQAKSEGITFITHDEKLTAYHEQCVRLI
ncbi:MAG: type II toxin-antitoxin system VapC family toxin [Cyanobacteria bacterium RUI128]|nr:type II toxin-antitoxin system VapC family toxin [Cyanobacteria bacterium RUI128]